MATLFSLNTKKILRKNWQNRPSVRRCAPVSFAQRAGCRR